MNFPGHVEKGMVILDQPLPLPDGTAVLVEPVPSAPGDFWSSATLGELAEQQGVRRPRTVDDLLGGWPADELDDQFEEALLQWRERELEHHS